MGLVESNHRRFIIEADAAVVVVLVQLHAIDTLPGILGHIERMDADIKEIGHSSLTLLINLSHDSTKGTAIIEDVTFQVFTASRILTVGNHLRITYTGIVNRSNSLFSKDLHTLADTDNPDGLVIDSRQHLLNILIVHDTTKILVLELETLRERNELAFLIINDRGKALQGGDMLFLRDGTGQSQHNTATKSLDTSLGGITAMYDIVNDDRQTVSRKLTLHTDAKSIGRHGLAIMGILIFILTLSGITDQNVGNGSK